MGFELGRDPETGANRVRAYDLPAHLLGVIGDEVKARHIARERQVVDVQRLEKLWLGGRDSNSELSVFLMW